MILFDTETTGLVKSYAVPLRDQPHMVEFAAIKLTDKKPYKEVERIEFLVKISFALPDIIKNITGLDDTDLADAEPFAAHYPKLIDFFFGERYLIGHNVKFDVDILRFALARLDKAFQFPWPPVHICTVVQSMDIKGHRLKQELLLEHVTGKPKKGAHRAMADVEDLETIVRWMIKEGRIKIG